MSIDRARFNKFPAANVAFNDFEKKLSSLNENTSLLVVKAILFRSAVSLFTHLRDRGTTPIDMVVYLGWILDGTGATPAGDERFLENAAISKDILVITRRE